MVSYSELDAFFYRTCGDRQPLRDYGIERMIREAKANVAATIHEDVVEWLPAAEYHFCGLQVEESAS